MTLIEGIGDEVIHFFLLLAVTFVALIAWWSTNLSERPLIRTVFIVERRTIRHAATDTQTITTDVTETSDLLPEGNETVTENEVSQSTDCDNDSDNQVEVSAVKEFNNGEVENAEPHSELSAEDTNENVDEAAAAAELNCSEQANESVVRNRILAFFNMKPDERNVSEESASPQENTSQAECETENSNDGNIRIRLKYINDDQKLVEGKLQEQLGDFKRRHFSLEMAGRKLVRLIFKGQVLQEDTKTLQNCGFFDNCVVHCLVQSRTPPPSPNLNRPQNESQPQTDNSQNWDLGNILFASVSLLLGLAWYGRYQYAQLYTATTTVVLVGLTGIFTVSLIGMYMPDTDAVDQVSSLYEIVLTSDN